MKGGLRLQLLVLLGVLLLLFYAPLFFATSTYTRIGLEQLQRQNAIKLGKSVATHLATQRKLASDEEFLNLARAQIQKESVHALSLIRSKDAPLAVLGEVDLLRSIAQEADFHSTPEVRQIQTPKGPAVLVFEPDPKGGVAAIVRVDAEVTLATPLTRLLGLYLAVGGVALLAAAYFALTRFIVRPILLLESDAERIASGGRMRPLERAPRELLVLSHRLSQMTEQLRQDEESLRKKVEELEAMTEERRKDQASLVRSERMATVGRLAAGLAHEVGNPISALMGLLDLLRSGGLSESEQKDFLERMHRETSRIDRVLRDLLAYARSAGERTTREGVRTPGDVAQAMHDVVALLRPQSASRDMRLKTELAPALPKVPLSQEELTQILLNLAMNAADACQANGEIVLCAEAPHPDLVRIQVDDNGKGIASEVTDHLFEPFVTTKEVGKGTGLGLAVTRGLVEGAGGKVWAESSPLGGARFVIELPVAARGDLPHPPA